MALSAGDHLGSYEILEPFGDGGMGEVYRATDTKLGRDVAIKVVPPEVAKDPARLERFQRQAHLLASLNHPYIPAIHGLVDRRADIWAFGAVLFEMLTGGPLFAGETITDLLAAVALPGDLNGRDGRSRPKRERDLQLDPRVAVTSTRGTHS